MLEARPEAQRLAAKDSTSALKTPNPELDFVEEARIFSILNCNTIAIFYRLWIMKVIFRSGILWILDLDSCLVLGS